MRTFLLLLCAAAMLTVAGCASSQPKSSARIYEGDAPSITYSKTESAGGPLGGR